MYSYDRRTQVSKVARLDTLNEMVGIVESVDKAYDGKDALHDMVTSVLPQLVSKIHRSPEIDGAQRMSLIKAVEAFKEAAKRAYAGLTGLGPQFDTLNNMLGMASGVPGHTHMMAAHTLER